MVTALAQVTEALELALTQAGHAPHCDLFGLAERGKYGETRSRGRRARPVVRCSCWIRLAGSALVAAHKELGTWHEGPVKGRRTVA